MDFRGIIKRKFLQNGLVLDKGSTSKSVSELLEMFIFNTRSVPLQRIGPKGDGGYLVPVDLSEISICFSPGVSDNSLFELELAERYGIRSYLADASVNGPSINHPNFEFDKKYLGAYSRGEYVTLQDWMEQKELGCYDNLMLQMDIEGFEYDVLTSCGPDILRSFKVMVIEFHDFERIFDRFALRFFYGIFSMILENFYIVHMHPNNSGFPWTIQNIDVPRYLEITFLRKDCFKSKTNSNLQIPHKLDYPCDPNRKNFTLDPKFWKK